MNADGSDAVRVSAGRTNIRVAARSPDAKRIVTVDRTSSESLVVSDPDGSHRVVLADLAADAEPRGAAWRRDGTRVTFATRSGPWGQTMQIVTTNPDGSGRAVLVDDADGYGPLSFSPDGSRVVYEAGGDLVIMSVDGGGRTRLGPATGQPWEVTWAPDGNRLALPVWGKDDDQATVVDSDGYHRHHLFTDSTNRRFAAWSPDGTKIAVATQPTQDEGDDKEYVEVVNVDGSGRPVQIDSKRYSHGEVAWSPDSRWLAFASEPHLDGWVITTGQADGTKSHAVIDCQYGFMPGRPVWSPDGSTLAFSRGGGVEVVAPDGSGHQRLTRSGDAPSWSPDGTKIAVRR